MSAIIAMFGVKLKGFMRTLIVSEENGLSLSQPPPYPHMGSPGVSSYNTRTLNFTSIHFHSFIRSRLPGVYYLLYFLLPASTSGE